ncbi:acetyltransferase, GNAT family protein [Tritrichomonas foetus]|uniref:N-alpha-acetyltransferase 60 n=1 Tax=Tritrichomonas foetus TaxID=1144522 RepID=A0A1J4JZU6_9EUKA|nr:acetyltransferase, GNAT family protein [Tritrichomonas foetus]|eukprot:OHT04210.1 acetyltransferase, GNAT family protein [Tritrichomonas foetus]
MNYQVRLMKYEDIDEVEKIHIILFPVRYQRKVFEEYLKPNYLALLLTIHEEGAEKIIGVSMSSRSWVSKFSYVKKSYLGTFGVIPEYQKKGLGSFLLRLTCRILGNYYQCSSMSLHMLRKDKEVYNFYTKNGLNPIQVLEKYYSFSEPREDALLMSCDLNKIDFIERDDILPSSEVKELLTGKQVIGYFAPWFSWP